MHAAWAEHAELLVRCQWNQTSSLMALLANCHRDPKRRSQAFVPSDFNPFSQAAEDAAPLKKIKPSQLARIVVGNERPEVVLADIAAAETAAALKDAATTPPSN